VPVPVTPDELHVRVVQRIREVARRKGLSVDALADAAEVSRSYLWKVLAGRFSPTIKTVAKIAGALEVDPLELFRKPKQ
jgi:transcriptional regulator with XRE-family HTH domain